MLLYVWKKRKTVARCGVRGGGGRLSVTKNTMTRKRRPVRGQNSAVVTTGREQATNNYVKETYYDTLLDNKAVDAVKSFLDNTTKVKGETKNAAEENGPALRSKRETCKRINYTEPKEDEECLIEERPKGKPLYKVIDKSMTYTKQHVHTGRDRFPGRPKPKVLSNLVAKIRKRRKTELSVLSDEADNFMFPRTTSRDPAEELDTKIDLLNHEMGVKAKSASNDLLTKETPVNGVVRSNRRKRNNIEPSAVDHEAEVKPESPPKVPNLVRVVHQEEVVRHRFAFERVPTTEPWFDAFLRQDEGREKVFEYYGSTAYRKLPFEMGPLPPLPPNCCSLVAIATKAGCSSKNATVTTTVVKVEKEEEIKEVTTVKEEKKTLKLTKKKRHLLDIEYPRKSPREHASTLAILSCLVQQRKKEESASESEKGGSDESDSCKEKRIKTASPKKVKSTRDYINVAQLNREIEELLTDPANESLESVDVSILENDDLFTPLNCLPDFVSLVTTTQEVVEPTADVDTCQSLKNTKKRKNNRTGWPKCSKKTRGVRKSTNSDTVVNVKSEDLCSLPTVPQLATSPESEIFTVSSSTESLQSSDLEGKTAATKDSDTMSLSAKSCFISDDPEEINGTNSSCETPDHLPKSPTIRAVTPPEEDRRSRRRNCYQPVIALNRLDTHVFNSYSLRSASVSPAKSTKGVAGGRKCATRVKSRQTVLRKRKKTNR
ncbi:hypothetical protein DMENIID0001_055790 [Sergentomyia squamirostris]